MIPSSWAGLQIALTMQQAAYLQHEVVLYIRREILIRSTAYTTPSESKRDLPKLEQPLARAVAQTSACIARNRTFSCLLSNFNHPFGEIGLEIAARILIASAGTECRHMALRPVHFAQQPACHMPLTS